MPPLQNSGETWSIPDVYLVTSSSGPRVAIPHLRLEFGPGGITLAKEDGELAWECRWSDLDEVSTAERSILPDGTPGIVVMVVEHGGRQHRFVVPTDDPEVVEADIRREARDHRVHTSMPQAAVSRTLTVAVVGATMATLTVLLLSAAHVLHF